MECNLSRLEVVRARLKDGRTIADSDVHWLVARIDALQAVAFESSHAPQAGWQPIEVCPKDKTKRLGVDDDGYQFVFWWIDWHWTMGGYEDTPVDPTHWIPLPDATKMPPAQSPEK